MIQTVAVIGLGAMGAPMARRVQGAGFELTVFDTNPAVLAAFEERGAKIARDAAACASCDMTIVLVATPEQVREVLLGDRGLCAAFAPDRSPLIALMGTMSPATVRDLEEAVRGAGGRLIDAPVSGGTVRAEEGTLAIMIGGEDEDVDEATPVLAAMGADRFHLGPVGAAQTLKILNNIIGIVNSIVSAETYALALENGLDVKQVARVFEAGSGRNWLSQGPAGPSPIYKAMLEAQDFTRSGLTILRKDLSLATELANAAPGAYPVIDGFAAIVNALGDETRRNFERVGSATNL